MAILLPDDKLDCFGLLEKNWLGQNRVAFYPGPVVPPRADGSPFLSSGRKWVVVMKALS